MIRRVFEFGSHSWHAIICCSHQQRKIRIQIFEFIIILQVPVASAKNRNTIVSTRCHFVRRGRKRIRRKAIWLIRPSYRTPSDDGLSGHAKNRIAGKYRESPAFQDIVGSNITAQYRQEKLDNAPTKSMFRIQRQQRWRWWTTSRRRRASCQVEAEKIR